MKIDYDKETDILILTLRESRIKESDELSEGLIADYDYDNNIVRLEILDASKKVFPLEKISFSQKNKFELELV